MGKLISKWYAFWRLKKGIFIALLSSIVLFFGYGISKLNITHDVVNSIDGSNKFSDYTNLLNNKGLNQDLTISIYSSTYNFDSLQQVALSIEQRLIDNFGEDIEKLTHLAPDFNEVYDFFYNQLPYYLDTNELHLAIDEVEQVRSKLISNHRMLYTPEGFFLKKYLFKDPFQFVPSVMENYKKSLVNSSITVIDGCFALEDSTLIIRGNFTPAFLNDDNRLDKLSEIEKWLFSKFPEIQIDYFTSSRIALENAKQVKKDTLLTLLVSLSIILFLLFFYYKKWSIPFFFLMPGAFGVLFSLGLLGWIRPEISGLSLGAGAVVIGIIMDYSFHFFTHLKHTGTVKSTLLDVAHPLIIGCFTTVLAFGALMYTNSTILNDFGLFAALSLFGTLLGVLLVLPVVLPQNWVAQFAITKAPIRPTKVKKNGLKKWGLPATVVLTVIAIMGISKVQFEGDLDQLNFYPEHIQQAEEKHTGFVSNADKKLFVAVSDVNLESALQKNESLLLTIQKQVDDSLISQYLSVSSLYLSDYRKNEKWNLWKLYWEKREASFFKVLDETADKLGYSDLAYRSFKEVINQQPEPLNPADYGITSEVFDKLVSIDSNKVSILTVVDAKRNTLSKTKQQLKADTDFVLLDRADLTEKMIESVQEDFNYILMVSSLIVFIVLLLNFGRIELTLITFLPMILSWVWILGFAGLMDIKFNLINVVVTTFIFGLGDDFAIFITEGKLNKYRNGSDSMSSFKTGIILSAITTIVGTGVLVLAKHPAIYSIGLISIVGLLSILFISLVVQPILFDFFISGRTEKKKAPLTLSGFLISLFAFTFFLVGCTIIFVVLLIFKLIPVAQKRLKYAMHHILRAFTWAQVYVMVNVRKKIVDRQLLNYDKPALIIANHQSFIDILVMIMLHPKVIIMTNRWVYNSPFFGAAVRYADYLPASDGYENMLPRIRQLVDDGYSIMIFPEGTRSKTEHIGRFHKGAFFLAQELNLDVQPILLHGFNFTMAKNDFLLKNGRLTIKALPRIASTDMSFGSTYAERTKKISAYFKKHYQQLQHHEKDAAYIRPALLLNYLYKSPSLEWYFRIKYRLEGKNYEFYNTQIGDSAKIYDLGCGLGFLSYYLKIANPTRQIIGVDYDEAKIELAQNAYLKDDYISFIASPIEHVKIEDAEVIFLMDVLHYLPEETQLSVLTYCAQNLTDNGILFIRDGIADDPNHHKNTERTEFFSTKLFGFNKTTSELHFFTSDFIRNFAAQNGFTFTMKSHSTNTSNHLFILKKHE